jgi:hypothetical protein
MAKGFTSYDVGSLQGATAARIDASVQEAMMHSNFERNPINNPRSAPMTLGIPSHSPPAAFRSQPREAIDTSASAVVAWFTGRVPACFLSS